MTGNKEQVLTELIRTHPTVSVIDIGSILLQVKGIIDKASLAVQVVFLFTLVAGLLVLFASVHATIDQRRFESAILITLGARRSTVVAGVLAEFAVIGMVAGFLASLGASLLAAAITVNLFDLEYTPNMLLWAGGFNWRGYTGMRQWILSAASCDQCSARCGTAGLRLTLLA